MAEILRLIVALAVVVLLGRAARPAWRNRGLALAVWRRIGLRHVLGCLALLVVVLGTAVGLLALVPVTGYGLGSLIGLSGNAVFAPLEEVTVRAGGPDGTTGGPGWGLLAATGGFLGLLLVMFPWLAYVEERVFREGLETAGPGREAWVALRFGLLHLVMLIPVAAALAVGVAGLFYGRVYRVTYARVAANQMLAGSSAVAVATGATRQARQEAVLAATVWHTTFNSLIVVLVLAGVVASVL